MTLTLTSVRKVFPATAGETVALGDFSLEIRAGEFLVIVGPSGCGKTTVLNLLAGLDRATSGHVAMDGREITAPGAERGVVFQDYALFPWRTVQGNVEFGLKFGPRGAGLSEAERAARVANYIDLVGLKGAEGKYPHQLSGGMKQRVALARVLANEPDVLLMDEPLAALDAQTRIILQDELVRIWGEDQPIDKRRTVVFITHAIDEAVFLADRIVVMASHPGRIKEIIDNPLPRPRAGTARGSPEFQALVQRIWELIRAEAYKATVT